MNEFVIPRPAGFATDPAAKPGDSSFALGIWLRAGFIGACLVLGALVSLSDPGASLGTALLLGLTGALLTAISWQRVRKVFRAEQVEETLAHRSPD